MIDHGYTIIHPSCRIAGGGCIRAKLNVTASPKQNVRIIARDPIKRVSLLRGCELRIGVCFSRRSAGRISAFFFFFFFFPANSRKFCAARIGACARDIYDATDDIETRR